MKYKILYNTATALVSAVNYALADGWLLYGPPVPSGGTEYPLAQAMVKLDAGETRLAAFPTERRLDSDL